jgi:hypothetical protein
MEYEKVKVTADGKNVYEAVVDRSLDWNGFLMPRFDLDTVKQIAADCDEIIAGDGYQHAEEIRIIEASGYTGFADGVDELESDPVTAVVVVHISWQWFFSSGPEHCAKVLKPGEDGRYAIGAGLWTWSEVTNPLDEVHWPTYVDEFARWALGEALWFESNPDENGVGGDEWESVEHLTVDDIADERARERWMQMCREFVESNKERLLNIPADRAGQMFWESKRGRWGHQFRNFRQAKGIPKQTRLKLHSESGRWPVGRLWVRDDVITFAI